MIASWMRKGRRLPMGMLGALALLVPVECAVSRHSAYFTTPSAFDMKLTAEAATHEARNCTLLCFGDSLVKHGLQPLILTRRLGEPVYNLAVSASQAPASYFLLRRVLRAGGHPREIVIDYKPNHLAGGPSFSLRAWQEALSFAETIELYRDDHDGTLLAQILLGRLIPSVRCRHEMRATILAALEGREESWIDENRLVRYHWGLNRGGHVAPASVQFAGTVEEAQHEKYCSRVWWCDRTNRRYIHKLLNLTRREGIKVYWLLPPIAPELQARRDQTGADAAQMQFIKRLQQEYANLDVLDGRHAAYAPNLFIDPVHVNATGASTLSNDVAGLLGQSSRERWMTLPPFGSRPSEVTLQDINQSQIALEAGGRARR